MTSENARGTGCTYCDLAVTLAGHVRHVNTAHRNMSTAELNAKEGFSKWRQCELCQSHFIGDRGLATHIRGAHGGKMNPVLPLRSDTPAFVPRLVQDNALDNWMEDQNNHYDSIPPAPWDYRVIPIPADYGFLVGKYHKGAFFKHHTWRAPLQAIVLQLLETAVSEDESISTRGLAALQILPGLVEHCRHQRRKMLTPIELLRSIEVIPDKAVEIIRLAEAWLPTLRAFPKTWPKPNVEHTRARIEALASENRLSSATAALGILQDLLTGVPAVPQASPEFIAQKIRDLHPVSDERDLLPDSAADPELDDCLQLNSDQVRDRFYSLKSNTSAGNTGWTNEWLRLVGDDRNDPNYCATTTPPSPIHKAFTAFFNKILQGRITGEGRELLVTARLIMINKPDGGLRPIRIECAIMRLFGAVASGIARAVIGPMLRPLQLGGGLKCGVEFGARLLDAAYERGDGIISVDIANAFNTARHRPIWDGLQQKYPGILRYYRMKYETPARMVNNEGKVIGMTSTGVGQGDPWGGLFFEVGVHPALLDLSAAVIRTEAQYNRETFHEKISRPGAVSAYEDDTQVRGEMEILFRLAPLIKDIFANHGFEVKVSKSKITGSLVEASGFPPDDFEIVEQGLIALGVPIGNAGYRGQTTEAMIEAMHPPTAAIQLLRPRTAILLLSSCFDSRPSFLLRTASNPIHVHRAAAIFDTKMCETVGAVFQLEVTEELKKRIFLKRRLGGLGFTRHHGMASEKNQLMSRVAFLSFLSDYYPTVVQATQTQYDLSAVHLGAIEDLTAHTGLTEIIMSTLTLKNCAGILAAAVDKGERFNRRKLHAELCNTNQYSKAAWLLSASESSTSCLFSSTGIGHEGYFGNAEFRCTGRAKLGAGPLNDLEGTDLVCNCRVTYDPLEYPFHAMSCSLTKGFRNKRHNDIRDLLFKLLKKRFPALSNESLKLEPLVGQYEGGERDVRADILWIDQADRVIIDIACVDPGCTQYLEAPVESWKSEDKAAQRMESVKRKHYSKVVLPAPLPANSVYPFVLEASGRLGPCALSLLNRICGTQTFLRSKFLKEVSLVTARYMGIMLKATRDQRL
jgi:Reverse transcriptase (RNA-dependent DNA polymerase)